MREECDCRPWTLPTLSIETPPVRVAIPSAGFGLEYIINVNGRIESERCCAYHTRCGRRWLWVPLYMAPICPFCAQSSQCNPAPVQCQLGAFPDGLVDIAMELREPTSGGWRRRDHEHMRSLASLRGLKQTLDRVALSEEKMRENESGSVWFRPQQLHICTLLPLFIEDSSKRFIQYSPWMPNDENLL